MLALIPRILLMGHSVDSGGRGHLDHRVLLACLGSEELAFMLLLEATPRELLHLPILIVYQCLRARLIVSLFLSIRVDQGAGQGKTASRLVQYLSLNLHALISHLHPIATARVESSSGERLWLLTVQEMPVFDAAYAHRRRRYRVHVLVTLVFSIVRVTRHNFAEEDRLGGLCLLSRQAIDGASIDHEESPASFVFASASSRL